MKAINKYNELDVLVNKSVALRKQFYTLLQSESPCFEQINDLSIRIDKYKKGI